MNKLVILSATLALATTSASAHDGMKFEPPDGMAYTGVGNDKFESAALEAVTAPFRLAHEKLYIQWDDGNQSHPFNPVNFTNSLNKIGQEQQIPQLGWTFAGFDSVTFNSIDVEMQTGRYDTYIDTVAAIIKNFDKPMFIAPGIEFNFSGYTKGEFPKAWRYLVDRFRDQGVNNVAWIWNAVIESTSLSQFDDTLPSGELAWWPGDEYVDGTSANVFVAHAWDPNSTTVNHDDLEDFLHFSEAHNKPMYNSETTGFLGIDNLDTTDPLAQLQANFEFANHFKFMLDYQENNTRAKGFVYISRDWTPFPAWGPAWGNQIIQKNLFLLNLFQARVQNGKYLNAGDVNPTAWSAHQIDKVALNDTVELDIRNVTPGAPAALFLSLSKLPNGVKIGGVPYGKFWLANPSFLLAFPADAQGNIVLPGVIPNNPLFVGISFYTQWVSADGAPAPMKIVIQ